MKLPENILNPDARKLRQFAAGWLIFFVGFAIYECGWRSRETLAVELGVVAVIGVLLCWLAPSWFRLVYAGCMLAALPVGWITSQIALGAMFYGVLTPVALLFKVIGRDRLRRRKPVGATTYWKVRPTTIDVRRYFRSY